MPNQCTPCRFLYTTQLIILQQFPYWALWVVQRRLLLGSVNQQIGLAFCRAWQLEHSEFTEKLPTRAFLVPLDEDEELTIELAKGNTITIKYKAISELQPNGTRQMPSLIHTWGYAPLHRTQDLRHHFLSISKMQEWSGVCNRVLQALSEGYPSGIFPYGLSVGRA